MRTTIILKDELYTTLIDRFGKRGISEAINDMLAKIMFKNQKEDLFGCLKGLNTNGLEPSEDEFE